MTEPDFWTHRWGQVICGGCELMLWACVCDVLERPDNVVDDVEDFLNVYSSENHSE